MAIFFLLQYTGCLATGMRTEHFPLSLVFFDDDKKKCSYLAIPRVLGSSE